MFVDEVVALPAPLAVARDRLLALMRVDAGWQDAASGAFEEGRQLLLLAGVVGATKHVIVQSLPAYLRGTTTVIPYRWVAAGPVGDLYPAVDANLELAPAEGGSSRLRFIGSYRPLPGHLDLTLDEAWCGPRDGPWPAGPDYPGDPFAGRRTPVTKAPDADDLRSPIGPVGPWSAAILRPRPPVGVPVGRA